MRFSGISGCLSAAVLALGVGGAPVVQADALGDSLEQAHIRKATFAAPAWEGYTNADGSGLYWDLLKQVYAPYGLDVKFINMPWNRANKLMTAGSMVDGVPGEIPGVEGKLYAQLPIDIEYHGVMHAAKTPFSGRASLTGKRVGWRHSYNLIPAEQRDFTLVECVRPERCTEQSRTASWISSSRAGRTGKAAQRSASAGRRLPDRATAARQGVLHDLRRQRQRPAPARGLRRAGTADGGVRRAAGALPALEQRGARRRAGSFGAVMRRSFPSRSLSGACAVGMNA